MAGPSDIYVFKDALIVLGTAAVVAPVVHRLKISPVLGFLVVGAALGPHGLGQLADYSRAIDWLTVTGERQIAFIADLGIVFLLFFIGLELSMRRMITMRRLVFGLGGLQVVLPDFGWTAWADAHPGGAVHWRGMSCGVVKPSKVDLAIIGKVLDTVREAWKRS